LRLVLLGARAIDGVDKRKRSTSRARKFGVNEVSESLVSFVATVVCLSDWLFTSNADEEKLFFLLQDSSTTFTEDDDRFRDFFEKRYISLRVGIRKKLLHVVTGTMQWLSDEVFLREDDEEQAEIDEEQQAYEEDLANQIEEASRAHQHKRKEAVAILRNEEPQDE